MKPAAIPTKKMGLGVDPQLIKTLAAVKEVAVESDIPTVVHPSTATKAEPVTTPAQSNVTTLPPNPEPQTKKARGPKPAPVKRTSVDLPVYVIEQIRSKAFHADKTKRRVILEALRAGGLTIKDIDLEEESAIDA